MRHIALSEIKDNLPRFLREAAGEGIVITRHGRPAGVLVGFATEDDWFDYRLEHDPRFLDRIAKARASIQAGRGVRLEDLNSVLQETEAASRVSPPVGTTASASAAPKKSRVGRARRS